MFKSVSLPWLEAFKCLNQSLHSNYQRTWHTDTQTDTAFYSLGYFFLSKETKNSIYSSIYLRTDVSEKVQCVCSRQHGLLHPRVSHRGTQCADLCLLPLGPPPLHRLQDCAPLILWQLTLWVSVKASSLVSFHSCQFQAQCRQSQWSNALQCWPMGSPHGWTGRYIQGVHKYAPMIEMVTTPSKMSQK